MRAQTKWGWLLFGYGAAVGFGGFAIARDGRLLALAEAGAGESGVLLLAAAGAAIVGGFAALIAVTGTRRLAQLAEQAEEIRLHPGLGDVRVAASADDEIVSLARTVNALRAELTKGEAARNQLVADAAHELRTPVAIVRGHLETMLRGAEELRPESLLPLLDETRRMSRLIQDLRDLNLAEAGRLRLERAWVPIAPTLREIVAIMAAEAEAKDVTVALEGDWDGEAYCDASRLKQIVVNLIGNAVRYAPAGGAVVVAFAEREGSLFIRVTDDGPGIPPEKLPYIFKRFYRVEDARDRTSGGTGLGLAIAKEFVEAHGGAIEAFSQPGEGASFLVRLPVFPLHP